MFKKVSLAFLFAATAMLMAHNFVPHSHYTTGAGEIVTTHCSHHEDNLLGLLASIFHLDLGNEHLANLKPASVQALNLIAPFVLGFVSFDLTILTEKESNHYLYPPAAILTNPFLLSLNIHRGPPAA